MKKTVFTALIMIVLAVIFASCMGEETDIKENGGSLSSILSEESSEPEKEDVPENETEKEPELSFEEPAAESFDRILVFQDDSHSEHAYLTEEELAEWLSIINPEDWKEDTAEKEGGCLSNNCIILGRTNATMYIGIDYTGDEIALIKWGGNYSKSYVMPKGTFEKAKAFEERIKKEQPTVFNYPECDFDISAQAFTERENDEYILWLERMLNCLCWPAATGLDSFMDYGGYSSAGELNSKQLFNCFMFIFDENIVARRDKLWLDETDGKYHIPIDDIYSILGKYFCDYTFDYTDVSINYEYDKYINGIIIPGGYGVGSRWGGESKVVSVSDNGDGSITAVIDIYSYVEDSEGGMVILEEPTSRNTVVLRPTENGCFCESYKIEAAD